MPRSRPWRRVAATFVDRCIEQLVQAELDTETAAMANGGHDMQQQVMDECVQLHGGYGYMNDYLVCRMSPTRACSASTAAPTRS